MPREWIMAVRRWSKMNEGKRRQEWPDRKTEYIFYQTLVGSWPLSLDRAIAYMQKAVREAKEQTDWCQPVPEYEQALQDFITSALCDPEFIADAGEFASRLLEPGWINSLAQTLVKLTAPGVPDTYQGAELWDLTLADPDNRRTVDFALRKRLLTEAKTLSAEEAWRWRAMGTPNLWLIWKVLNARRSHPDLFGRFGGYEPLPVHGEKAAHVLAFMRGGRAVTVVPRLTVGINGVWADTSVEIPAGSWRNSLTNEPIATRRMSDLLRQFPVAFLLRES
jgi:(1->4)-alpha-D-glucan 1-alpha-D-glucosylmutase